MFFGGHNIQLTAPSKMVGHITGLTWCWKSTKSCNLGTMAIQRLGLGTHITGRLWYCLKA